MLEGASDALSRSSFCELATCCLRCAAYVDESTAHDFSQLYVVRMLDHGIKESVDAACCHDPAAILRRNGDELQRTAPMQLYSFVRMCFCRRENPLDATCVRNFLHVCGLDRQMMQRQTAKALEFNIGLLRVHALQNTLDRARLAKRFRVRQILCVRHVTESYEGLFKCLGVG